MTNASLRVFVLVLKGWCKICLLDNPRLWIRHAGRLHCPHRPVVANRGPRADTSWRQSKLGRDYTRHWHACCALGDMLWRRHSADGSGDLPLITRWYRGGPAGGAANMNTLVFWDQAERVGFYECLPGPPFLYMPYSAQGDGLRLKMYAMSFNVMSTIPSLPLNRVNSYCLYVVSRPKSD